MIDSVGIDDGAIAQTRAAMIEGHPIIVQGAFRLNGWVGRTDIRRIETPSDLGAWSYEVTDTGFPPAVPVAGAHSVPRRAASAAPRKGGDYHRFSFHDRNFCQVA